MEMHIFPTAEETVSALAGFFISTCRQAIKKNKKCTVALSGGNSPARLYKLLASEAFRHQLDWSKLNFFLGDERYVPLHDPASNAGMIRKTLVEPLQLSNDQFCTINTEFSPGEAAHDYALRIMHHFESDPVHFDLILLGLGDNAHTASLFPHTPVLHESLPDVKAVYLEEEHVYRITLNAPMINNALRIAFLVFGKEKALAVSRVLEGKEDTDAYPAQLIRPLHGDVHWFLDQEAADELKV
ncbi:MAG TPA: 6-phosphogluconolactonase [Flavitalea sp.]|nr:6-phosphogluconolactonase [Flavitalea sp.]